MRKILLDTNGYAAFKQGNTDILAILQHADLVGLSVIVLGELIAGFTWGMKTQDNLKDLNEFLQHARVKVFAIDEETTAFYAQIYATLRRKGKPIPTNDLWIAATALQQGCKLCSFDAHFALIDNLVIANNLTNFLL